MGTGGRRWARRGLCAFLPVATPCSAAVRRGAAPHRVPCFSSVAVTPVLVQGATDSGDSLTRVLLGTPGLQAALAPALLREVLPALLQDAGGRGSELAPLLVGQFKWLDGATESAQLVDACLELLRGSLPSDVAAGLVALLPEIAPAADNEVLSEAGRGGGRRGCEGGDRRRSRRRGRRRSRHEKGMRWAWVFRGLGGW